MKAVRLLPLLLLAAGAALGAMDQKAALREGNRLFHAGDLEAALEAYAAGYPGTASTPSDTASDPGLTYTLAYNLGTTAHHLERLPEALLWYRRAEELSSGSDPWLRENLELVRAQLGETGPEDEPATGLRKLRSWSFWMEHRPHLALTGAILAWCALPAVLLPRSRRARRLALLGVAALAGLPFLAALLLEGFGPRAAVLLGDCPPGAENSLPAGSEILVFPVPGGGWRLAEGLGDPLHCPEKAMGLIDSELPAFRFRGISGIVFGPATVESRSWSGVAMGTQKGPVAP